MLKYENKYWESNIKYVAGIDEAGRGPLAGPVVAAAVIFPDNIDLPEVNDSKKISEKKREILFHQIFDSAISIGVGIVYEKEIDRINILQATYKAMKQSVGRLSIQPEILLIDGNKTNLKHYKQNNIIHGDQKSLSIAAASIIAKVTRDHIMRQYDIVFPDYGFAQHKGYGTKRHIESIMKNKAVLIHRKSFKPVNRFLPNIAYYKQNNLFHLLGIQIIACKKIRKKYAIMEINYQYSEKEKVDIISSKNNILVFTIIKINLYNNSLKNIEPMINIEQSSILKAMISYNNEKKLKYDYRLDFGEVILRKGVKPKLNILKGNITTFN